MFDLRRKDVRFNWHKAIYIGWYELDDLLQEIMDDTTIEAKRDDYYYFYAYSEGNDTDYSDSDMCSRISDYLDIKFSSYHADDGGVWFIIAK